DRERLPRGLLEVEEEGSGPGLPGDGAEGRQIDRRARIRISAVPAGHLRVVVELIARVPAEDHVAEPEPALGDGEELVEGDVLAAQDPVDVETADLHSADPEPVEFLAERFDLRGARLDCRLHVNPPAHFASN